MGRLVRPCCIRIERDFIFTQLAFRNHQIFVLITIENEVGATLTRREEIPEKNIEEKLASPAVVAASKQALYLCRVVG
jgi:hypothetical protein